MNERNDRVRSVRMKLGKTQAEFAADLGSGRGVIANIENNLTCVKDNFLNLICTVYGANKEYLFDGKEPMFQPKPIEDEIAAISAKAALNNPEDAKAFIQRMYEDLGEAKFLLVYEIFRHAMPQYDKPIPQEDE